MTIDFEAVRRRLHESISKISTIYSINIYKFVVRANRLTFIAFDAVMRIETSDPLIDEKIGYIINTISKESHMVIFPIVLIRKPGDSKEAFLPIRDLTDLRI